MGDLLAGVPALRAVRRGLPGHHIVLAAPRGQATLLRGDRLVDADHHAVGLEQLGWPGPPPDVAIDLHGRGPQSHRLLASLRPRRLIAFECAEADVSGPTWVADEHERQRWCRLVSSCLGVTADADDVALTPPAIPPPVTGAVVVHPGAAYPARRWHPDRFAEVAAALAGDGLRVVVTGGYADRSLATAVAAGAGLDGGAVLAGSTSLLQLAALVAAARLVVSGDTGVAHLAAAYGAPSVVLFGPTPPRLWGPPEGPHTVIWHGHDCPGDAWGARIDPALAAIGVAEVVAAARNRLSSAR